MLKTERNNPLGMEDEEFKDFMAKCYADLRTATILFPELFNTEFSILHDSIFALMDSDLQKVAIAAPRGIGKTTIARTLCAREILFRKVQFIVYISKSSTLAELQTENIKFELQSNPIIRSIFGDLQISDYDSKDETFSKKAWVAFGHTLVLPRGAGQQIRSLNWRGTRPQLIVVDDLEDKKEVLNETNRQNLKTWFFSDVMKSVDRFRKEWRIRYIDTVKHEASLLEELLKASDWKSVRLGLCTPEYKSLVPAYMTDEEIQKEVEEHREKGLMDLFYMEYMNLPISTEDATFRQSYFKYYDEGSAEFLELLPGVENMVIVDPAKTVQVHSAETGIVGIGVHMRLNRIYLRDLIAKKLHPDEIINEAIDMCMRLRARVLAIETTSLNEFITYPVRNELVRRGLAGSIELIELPARGKKEDRIAAMVPFYRKGLVYHNSAVSGPLEQQLLGFPRSARMDAMDAMAYFVELLERGLRYFEPSEEAEEQEFERLYEEDLEMPMLKWRWA